MGAPTDDDGGSWRRGMSFPETAAAELEEGGAMARSDLAPEDLAAVISVLEYAITNFRWGAPHSCSFQNGTHALCHPSQTQVKGMPIPTSSWHTSGPILSRALLQR